MADLGHSTDGTAPWREVWCRADAVVLEIIEEREGVEGEGEEGERKGEGLEEGEIGLASKR